MWRASAVIRQTLLSAWEPWIVAGRSYKAESMRGWGHRQWYCWWKNISHCHKCKIKYKICIKYLQIQFLESLLEMWLEYESSIQALKSWMASQEERLKRKHRIEDLTSVQNALKDCQVGFIYCANTDLLKDVVPQHGQLFESMIFIICKLLTFRKWKSCWGKKRKN